MSVYSAPSLKSHSSSVQPYWSVSSNHFDFVRSKYWLFVIPMMNDGGTAIINVNNSSLTDVTSDIIEPIALGTNQYLEVNLRNVTVSRANGEGASPLIDIAGQFSYGNEGDCLSMFSTDTGNTLKLTIEDSTFSDCYFNGISIASNHRPGGGNTALIDLQISNTE